MNKMKIKTVDEYLANFPENVRSKLKKLRQAIKQAAPEAQEIISYNMPAFKLNKRILVYYAAHTNHIGFYSYPSSIIAFKKELSNYETSKATIKFPLNKPLPLTLIKKIIKFRVKDLSKK